MEESDITKTLAYAGYMILPEAARKLASYRNPEKMIRKLLLNRDALSFIISEDDLTEILNDQDDEPDPEDGDPEEEYDIDPFSERRPDPSAGRGSGIPGIASDKENRPEGLPSEKDRPEGLSSEEDRPEGLSSEEGRPEGLSSEKEGSDKAVNDTIGSVRPAASGRDDGTDPGQPFSENDTGHDPAVKNIRGPRYPFEKNPVDIIKDIGSDSESAASYGQYISYFRDRYRQILAILNRRGRFAPIASVIGSEKKNTPNRKTEGRRKSKSAGRNNSLRGQDIINEYQEVSVAGFVSDKKETTNRHIIITLEDPTGTISVLVDKNNTELYDLAEKLVSDEIIGVSGMLSGDNTLINADRIVQPGIPNMFRIHRTDGFAVFISDIHVGSREFMKDEWEMFLEFLRGETENEIMKNVSGNIRYLIVAGDIVDGIGIYPGQDKDLDIPDIRRQYEEIARYFRQVPENIHVVICPGNHDAVRRAEPQTTFPKEIRDLFPGNVTFVGNPATVSLDGVHVLMYHGCSMDDMVANIKGVTYEKPVDGIREMLIRRHLAPTFGSRVIIAPEKKDYLVIDPVPDIVHCGHVHTVGVDYYKGLILINSGTWQAQTDFQRRVNIRPDPAIATVVNLRTWEVQIFNFNYIDSDEEDREKEEKEKQEQEAIAGRHRRKKKDRRRKRSEF